MPVALVHRAFAGFRFMLASRGWRRGFYRASLIWRRFGWTRRRMEKNLRALEEVLEKHEAKATFFVPATVLADHRKSLEAFMTSSIEWGVHSDYHTDLSRMTPEQQHAHITNAVRLFHEAEVPFTGFRAPYLKTNAATAAVLRDAGVFVYDSSPCVIWQEVYGPGESSYDWIQNFYKPEPQSECPALITDEEGLLRIPVSLPDDDILVDRDRLSAGSVHKIWQGMLEQAHEEDQIFVLQLHPERGCELAEVLDKLLARSRELGMWVPTLGEIAARARDGGEGGPGGFQGVFCVTGDLDAMAVSDFAARLKTW